MEQLRHLPVPVTHRPPDFALGVGGEEPGFSTDGTVQVVWGAMVDDFDLVGMTVGEVATLLRRPYRLAPGVVANVNGEETDADTRLCAGDELEFVRAAGEKGAAA